MFLSTLTNQYDLIFKSPYKVILVTTLHSIAVIKLHELYLSTLRNQYDEIFNSTYKDMSVISYAPSQ